MQIIHVRLGAGIIEVLSLDDIGIRRSLGVDYEPAGRRHITLRGTSEALRRLAGECRGRCSGGWDQPLWYASSATSAARRIDMALTAANGGGG